MGIGDWGLGIGLVTKVTYTYEDGSTKVVTQNESHDFVS